MAPRKFEIDLEFVTVAVERKRIKHMYLRVYPPHGQVKVTAPLSVNEASIHRFLQSKLEWIRRQQENIKARQTEHMHESSAKPGMRSGEIHYFMGRAYRLRVAEQARGSKVELRGDSFIHLVVPFGSTSEGRRKILDDWYRDRLSSQIPLFIAKWEPILGVDVAEWRIKRMKTRWGTCNTRARRIWLSLELAKKPARCLEYVIVHEMVHLLERLHNKRFYALMDHFMPEWRTIRQELNAPMPRVSPPEN